MANQSCFFAFCFVLLEYFNLKPTQFLWGSPEELGISIGFKVYSMIVNFENKPPVKLYSLKIKEIKDLFKIYNNIVKKM